jgi:hypothetical protein
MSTLAVDLGGTFIKADCLHDGQILSQGQIPGHSDQGIAQALPRLRDQCRAAWLVEQLRWVQSVVREFDSVTPTCVNPPGNLSNLAASGTDLSAMAAAVDVLGASFHPAWNFAYANRHDYAALIATGVRQLIGIPGATRVEVTEVQTGNTTESSVRPNDVTAGEIARYHLAGLAAGAGAESVTGWCFNIRLQDNEAGDWALLDDRDQPSGRSLMLRKVADRISDAIKPTGPWRPAPPQAIVLSSPDSQAIELVVGKDAYTSNYGRRANDGPEGASLLAVSLMHLGLSTTIACPADAASLATSTTLIVASHITSWDRGEMKKLLSCVQNGATLLVDGISGRRDHDAAIYQPWPGDLAEVLGIVSARLETRFEGWPWSVEGFDAATSVLTRIVLKDLTPDWRAWQEARFIDGEPCIFERSYGKGRVVIFRGTLGASRLASPANSTAIQWLLRKLSPAGIALVAPVAGSPFTVAIPVSTQKGQLIVVLAPDRLDRQGQLLRLRSRTHCGWLDLWTGEPINSADVSGEFTLLAEEGVALLWTEQG